MPTSNNHIKLYKVLTEFWQHGNVTKMKSDRNISSQSNQQVSQTYAYEWTDVMCGVPQGSILEPFLTFTLF